MPNVSEINVNQCTGCALCSQVCPTDAIRLQYHNEGFLMPQIDDRCINCGKCIRICPNRSAFCSSSPMSVLATPSKDEDLVKNSSSAGVFFLIANAFISLQHGYVCGCVMQDYKVFHVLTNKQDDLVRMQGSKYVQSDVSACYNEISKLVTEGTPVLFSGTPCQVAAVRAKCGNADNLYTIDVICHGVTSPIVFREYMEKTYPNLDLNSFRYKNPYEISTYAFSFANGSRVNGQLDPFYNSFLTGKSLRESCYSCVYACSERMGDISLGDCANYRAYSNLCGRPVSTVIINTLRGKELWGMVESQMESVLADYQVEKMMNHQLSHPVVRTELRDQFYTDFRTLSKEEFKAKYAAHWSVKKRLSRFIITHIPYSLRHRFR